ncbi:SIR2 family protein [Ilumatobacter sp.]|uniref:SIR2 family protein n=1 Tax=Ilumatobacter sp. TaxID=1967498 RepID=UPI0037506FC1
MNQDQFVEEFGAAIESGQASTLVGAGLSTAAGYPAWGGLVEVVAARFGVPIGHDLPLAAQYVETQPGGKAALIEHLVSEIGGVTPVPTENHYLISQLPIRDHWTTNYDALIESADDDIEVISQDSDFVERRVGVRRLHKMHGSIPNGSPVPVGGRDQIVISRDDYERYEQTHPRFWRLLQGQFLTTSFLFIGFSLTDPNFDAVFRLVRLAISDGVMPHYAIMKRPAPDDDDGTFDLRTSDLQRVGVSIVEVEDYAEITHLLRRLVARTLPAQLFVAGSHRSEIDTTDANAKYPTADPVAEVTDIAQRLGTQLAIHEIPGIVAAGEVGATVGYSFIDGLETYFHERFTLVRRTKNEELDPPNLRRGQIQFTGEDPTDLRSAVFAQVRGVVVIGGTSGTLNEVEGAGAAGMSVVPLACSGGAARTVYETMQADLAAHRIGQRPIDAEMFELLNSPDIDTAVSAAVGLIKVALFMPSAPS